jgi:hypothetical protein
MGQANTSCGFCGAAPNELLQVVVPKAESDTSAFEYQLACEPCVKAKGLLDKVIQRKKVR